MIRFDERTGYLFPTDLGRTSSQFYIKYDTIEIFNELLQPVKNEAEIIAMISRASEFEQLKVRDDEMDELDDLTHEWCQVNFRYCKKATKLKQISILVFNLPKNFNFFVNSQSAILQSIVHFTSTNIK